MTPRPATAAEAVSRAVFLLASPGNAHTGYMLGTGDYRQVHSVDVPWTQTMDSSGLVHVGCDCAGFALCWCYKVQRHRPGYNVGPWATVSDDVNSNSAIEDADHAQDLFRRVAAPEPGDLLAYPTIHLAGHTFIGHVALIIGVGRAGTWDPRSPAYHLLDIAQACGPNGRKPACIATDGHVFDKHNETWPKSPTVMLRAVP